VGHPPISNEWESKVIESTTVEQVSDDQLAKYADLVYRQTGIRISPKKKALLSNRLQRRLRETGIVGYGAYYEHLKKLKSDDQEWDKFLEEITTHETYLFRDESQWDWFRTVFLPERAGKARAGKSPRSLRVWSAACSTGDEATSVATCIAGCLHDHSKWDIQIVGTDIGIGALEKAKNFSFGERAMRLVPSDYKRRFFQQTPGADQWQAKPVLQNMIKYRPHNLMDAFNEKPFDLIFLKNVLIYFDAASKQKVISHVQRKLKPGGYFVAGGAEGVSEFLGGLERISAWLYLNPETKG